MIISHVEPVAQNYIKSLTPNKQRNKQTLAVADDVFQYILHG